MTIKGKYQLLISVFHMSDNSRAKWNFEKRISDVHSPHHHEFIQVDESDVGSDRFQCWILSEPMLDHMGSDNLIGSYWIPGDEIRSDCMLDPIV